MTLSNCLTRKLSFNYHTNEIFSRELDKQEQAEAILGSQDMDATTKVKKLMDLGFDLIEIFEMAINFR